MPKEAAETMKSDMVFIVSEPEYMRKLNTILLNTDKRCVAQFSFLQIFYFTQNRFRNFSILSNYVLWRLVKGWAKLLDSRYDDAFQVRFRLTCPI